MNFAPQIHQFGDDFGVFSEEKCDKKTYTISKAFSESILGVPGHPPRPKPLILLGALFKIEGRPFRARELPGSIFDSKVEPKWILKVTKNAEKCTSKFNTKFYAKR